MELGQSGLIGRLCTRFQGDSCEYGLVYLYIRRGMLDMAFWAYSARDGRLWPKEMRFDSNSQ